MIREIVSVLCVMLPSTLTCMIYRLLGHNIGINAKIPIFSYVHANEINIGNDVCIKQLVLIRVEKLSIGDNSIIGISTNIGHEAQIANNCVFSSNCVVARRAKVNDHVWVGPSSVIREHVIIGKYAQIKLGSVVISNVDEAGEVSGNFALNHKKNLRNYFKTSR